MGTSRRKLYQLRMNYAKRVKKPIDEVLKLMPPDFTDEMFVNEFKCCYGYLWQELYKERKYYEIKNKTFRGKKPLLFPTPYSFVLNSAFQKLKRARSGNSNNSLSEEKKQELRNKLIEGNRVKMKKQKEKVNKNTELLQNVVPNYASNMIQSYFSLRRQHPEDINGRFYVLNEIAKFNNKRFIGFFMHVMKSEKNDACRMFAFNTLQKWDSTVHLTKNRKGKKPYDKIKPVLPSSPDELMALISRLQMERDKSYNVFLSHCSIDRDLIIRIKDALNRSNLSVYVDWMIDRDGLQREKVNKNTWATLEVRMNHCDCMLYVHTKNCNDSLWIPKEIAFALEHGIPLSVLNADGSSEKNDLTKCTHFVLEDNALIFTSLNGNIETFDRWIKTATYN